MHPGLHLSGRITHGDEEHYLIDDLVVDWVMISTKSLSVGDKQVVLPMIRRKNVHTSVMLSKASGASATIGG